MSANELKSLAKIIKSGWKQLALADQEEPEQLIEILKETLEALETLEGNE